MDTRIAHRMRDHVLEIAEEAGIRVDWVPQWRNAEAFPEGNHVIVPIIRHGYDYLFALHELGHVLSVESVMADGDDVYSRVLSEGAAWAWAAANVSRPLTRHLRAKDWDTAAYAFRTYVAGGTWPSWRWPAA